MKKTFGLLLLLGILGLLASGCGHGEGSSSIIGGGPISSPGGGTGAPGTLKWSFDIAPNAVVTSITPPFPFVSSPALAPDGTLYIGSGNHFLYAINSDGTLKWKYETGGSIAASPAIGSDGTIFFGSVDRQFYAINPDGTLKWIIPTKSVFTSSAAIAADGTIYAAGTELDKTILCSNTQSTVVAQLGNIYAIDPNNPLKGPKWVFTLSGTVHSSPAIAPDGTIYIGSDGDVGFDRSDPCDPTSPYPPSDLNSQFPVNGHFLAFNPDGSLKWDIRTLGQVHSSPAIASDGTIYVGSHYPEKAYGKDAATLISVGSATTGYLMAIKPDGTIKWVADLFGAVDSSPAVGSDGTIYVGSDDNHVWALNPDGTLKWVRPTRDMVKSSPALATDGTIYIGSNDGSLYAFDSDGTLKSRIEITETGSVNSSPTIGPGGTVYVATGGGDDKVHAVIGDSIHAQAPWPKFRHDLKNTGSQ